MKKTIYLAAITLITIGCVIYGVYGLSNRGLAFSFGNSNSDTAIGTTLESFERITVDADVMDFIVKEGSAYALDYQGAKNLVMSYRVDNGELVITQKKKNGMIGNNEATLIVTVPRDAQFTSVNLDIDVGDIDLKEMKVSYLDADIDVGDVTVEKANMEQAVIESDTGDIKLKACAFVNLDISSDVGDVEVSSSADISKYTYDLKTDVGEVEVYAGDYGRKYYQEGENGKIIVRADVGDITVMD